MSNKRFLLLIILFAAIVMGANVGAFDADLMEARNFVTAREMLQDGHWWETTMNGLPRLEKPPLPTWMTAIAGSFSASPSPFLLRLPAVLMGILLVVWVYQLGQSLFQDENKARWSAFVAASSMLIVQLARTGSWDIYFVSFAIGSFVFLHRGLKKDGNAFGEFALGGLLLGCSILSKGPVAGIMLVGFAGGLLLLEGYKPFLKKWKEIAVTGILAGVIGFGWPVYNILYQADAAQAVIDKEAITWTTKHVKPFYFYLIFPAYMGIWGLFVLFGLVPKIGKKYIGKSYGMLLVWLFLTLLFLSLLPMKKERYLLPAMPILALMVGALIAEFSKHKEELLPKRLLSIGLGIIGLLFTLSPVVAILQHSKMPEAFDLTGWIGVGLVSLSGLFILYRLWKSEFDQAKFLSGFGIALISVFLVPSVVNLYYKNTSFESPASLMENPELQNRKLYSYGDADMRVVYSIGQTLHSWDDYLASNQKGTIVLLTAHNPEKSEKMFRQYRPEIIDSSGFRRRANDVRLYAYLMHLDEKN